MGIKKNNPGCNCCESGEVCVCDCEIRCDEDTNITVDQIEVTVSIPDVLTRFRSGAGLVRTFHTWSGLSAFNGTYQLNLSDPCTSVALGISQSVTRLEQQCFVDGSNCKTTCTEEGDVSTTRTIPMTISATLVGSPTDPRYDISVVLLDAVFGFQIFGATAVLRCFEVNILQAIDYGSCANYPVFNAVYGTASPVPCGNSRCVFEEETILAHIEQIDAIIDGVPSTVYGGQTDDNFFQLNGVTAAIEGTYSLLLNESDCSFTSEIGDIDTTGMTATMISVDACIPAPATTTVVNSITGQYTIQYNGSINGLVAMFTFFMAITGDSNTYIIFITYLPSTPGQMQCSGGSLSMQVNREPYIIGGTSFACTGYENASNTASSYEITP